MNESPFDAPIEANGRVSFCNLNSGTPNDNLTTLTAKWSVNSYKIKFEMDGGEDRDQLSVEYDTWKSIPATTRQGYHFTGWVATGHSTSTAMYSITSGESVPMNRSSFTVPATGNVSFRNLSPYSGRQITLTA